MDIRSNNSALLQTRRSGNRRVEPDLDPDHFRTFCVRESRYNDASPIPGFQRVVDLRCDLPGAPTSGIDMEGELIRTARVALFSPKLAQIRKDLNKYASADDIYAAAQDRIDMQTMSIMPDIIKFGTVADKTYGYIRIFRFAPPEPLSVDDFIKEVVRILGLMPENGLILDVRGNPGGLIVVGERLLQLFTPRTIETERLQFVNTPATLALSKKFNDTMRWTESIGQSVETGSAFSQALPIESAEKANEIGQRYQGPVVLITDARCYSTTDIFAAGFEDNEVGAILAVRGGNHINKKTNEEWKQAAS